MSVAEGIGAKLNRWLLDFLKTEVLPQANRAAEMGVDPTPLFAMVVRVLRTYADALERRRHPTAIWRRGVGPWSTNISATGGPAGSATPPRSRAADALHRLAARGNAELAVDRDRLGLDRVARQAQPLADLQQGEMGRQQRQQAQLGRGQRRRPRRPAGRSGPASPPARPPGPAARPGSAAAG